MNSCCRY